MGELADVKNVESMWYRCVFVDADTQMPSY